MIGAARTRAYRATYSLSAPGGATQTVFFEQSPPRARLTTSGGSQGPTELLVTASASYVCADGGRPPLTCVDAGGPSWHGPLSTIADGYDGATALTAMRSWQGGTRVPAGGGTIFSTATVAGRPVRCARHGSGRGATTYCVTSDGVLARMQSPAGSLVLTSLGGSAPAGDFALPAGATVATLPGGRTRG